MRGGTGTLTDGKTYTFTAAGSDGTDTSPPSPIPT
jgi:hypothetical protein